MIGWLIRKLVDAVIHDEMYKSIIAQIEEVASQ